MKQIMMKGKQRVKGTVLFTVVSVMMIMVVFLMSTLILTTSANRRSYYTYYETQAQYAAQSALDCITNFAYSDTSFSNWVTGLTDDDPHEIFINYDGSKLSLTDANAPDSSVRCTITREKPNYIYDSVTEKIHERQQWKITATAVIGTGRNQTSSSLTTYLYSNVKAPKTSDAKNEFAFTMYEYDEVEEELPDEYEDDPGSPFVAISNAVYTLAPMATDDNVVVLGPQYSGMTDIPKGRTKYGTTYKEIQNNLGGVSDGVYIGNAQIKVLTGNVFQRMKNSEGFAEGMQYYGNLLVENNGDYFASRVTPDGTLDSKLWDYTKLSYLYVDGTINTSGGKMSIGMKGFTDGGTITAAQISERPVNLFAGAVNFPAANTGLNVCGDAYLYDSSLNSTWAAFRSTILADFISRVTNGTNKIKTASYATTTGNLVCNNQKITFGEGSDGQLIEGNLIYTNPNGSVTFNYGANAGNEMHVKGKAIFACERSKITGIGKLKADGGIICKGDANYETELAAMLTSSGTPGKYGTKTLAEYRAACGTNDFSLLPFNYRLDEIFDHYTRWDLQSTTKKTGAYDGADPLIKESQACGHEWNWTEMPYGDGTKTIWVPTTKPVFANNIIMKAFVPVASSTVTSTVASGAVNNLAISKAADFRATMQKNGTGGTGVLDITASNKDSYGHSGALAWAYPSNEGVKESSLTNAYYVNFDCEIDCNTIGTNEILFLDPTQAKGGTLRVLLKGSLNNKIVLINNTAQYKGGVAAPAIDYTYDDELDLGEGKKGYTYFGREEVLIFLDKGINIEKAMFLTTGVAGGYNGSLSQSTVGATLNLDLVSNPYYPGQDGWKSLSTAEKMKFFYVPNDIIFGEDGATYTFQNGGMFTGVVMMPYSTVVHKSQTQKISDDFSYRMDHESERAYPQGTKGLGSSGNKPVCVCVGSCVVGNFEGSNVAMVAYMGDGNRNGGKIKKKKKVTKEIGESYDDSSEDPTFIDGRDNFSNDHIGLH